MSIPFPMNSPYMMMPYAQYHQAMPMKLPTGVEDELYVGDLDERIDEATLHAFLQPYGNIYSIKIMRHAQKHTSRRFGYVVFYNSNDVIIIFFKKKKQAKTTQKNIRKKKWS
jgi:hypothetical protein